jgi:hypothetical protein
MTVFGKSVSDEPPAAFDSPPCFGKRGFAGFSAYVPQYPLRR